MSTPALRTRLKLRNRKTAPQARFKTTLVRLQAYPRIAARWGYTELAPFLRDLLDAADAADPHSGVIQLTPPFAREAAKPQAA